MNQIYDIIVLGGGHAGLEAAHISSTFNLSVGLFILPGVKIASESIIKFNLCLIVREF